jgi:hypothetical protein
MRCILGEHHDQDDVQTDSPQCEPQNKLRIGESAQISLQHQALVAEAHEAQV